MALSSILSVSLSGMTAAARRLEASAANVANVDTVGALPTDGAASSVYRARTVVQTEVDGGGVSASVVETSPGWVPRAAPGSPFADASGLVAAPDVDLASEAVTQITARFAYAASAKTMKVADEMAKTATDALA